MISSIIFVVLMVVACIVILFDTMPNTNKCNGNCNQGRNCDCGEK